MNIEYLEREKRERDSYARAARERTEKLCPGAASNEDYMDCTVLPFHATTRDFFEVASWLRDVLYDPVERRGFLRRTARCLAPLVALITKERTNGGRQNNAGEALPLLLFLG